MAKARHPGVAQWLAPEDILIDTNRGRATAWYRVRINLKSVPEAERPPPEPPDPDYDPKSEYAAEIAAWKAAQEAGPGAPDGAGDPEKPEER